MRCSEQRGMRSCLAMLPRCSPLAGLRPGLALICHSSWRPAFLKGVVERLEALAKRDDFVRHHRRIDACNQHARNPVGDLLHLRRLHPQAGDLDRPDAQATRAVPVRGLVAWQQILIGLTQLRACAPTWLAQTQPIAPWVQPETAVWPVE